MIQVGVALRVVTGLGAGVYYFYDSVDYPVATVLKDDDLSLFYGLTLISFVDNRVALVYLARHAFGGDDQETEP